MDYAQKLFVKIIKNGKIVVVLTAEKGSIVSEDYDLHAIQRNANRENF